MKKRGKNKQNKNKKAQLFGMPFSIIFSIFLIVVFLIVAFFAINKFIEWRKCSEIGLFRDDLQSAVDDAWQSQSSSKTFSSNLPSGIEYVCFADLSEEESGDSAKEKEIYNELKKNADYTANLYFYPRKKACIASTKIEDINIKELSNPYCFPVQKGKVEIKLEKGFYDALVKVTR